MFPWWGIVIESSSLLLWMRSVRCCKDVWNWLCEVEEGDILFWLLLTRVSLDLLNRSTYYLLRNRNAHKRRAHHRGMWISQFDFFALWQDPYHLHKCSNEVHHFPLSHLKLHQCVRQRFEKSLLIVGPWYRCTARNNNFGFWKWWVLINVFVESWKSNDKLHWCFSIDRLRSNFSIFVRQYFHFKSTYQIAWQQ